MKVKDLIEKLKQTGMDNEVVIQSQKHEGSYTADLGISYDDRGDVIISEPGWSKPY